MAKIMKQIARFRLSDHVNIKLFILMLSGFVFLAFAISAMIIIMNIRDRKAAEADLAEQSSFVRSLDSSLASLQLSDFIFPEQVGQRQTEPHLQREHQKSWSREEIERYWIELDDTGIADISEHNRELVDSLMDTIP
jgi:flagellar biosynthesis/type III secretory pathway M-ring protein FliF/YscJ